MLAGARPSMNPLEIRRRRRLILPFPSAPPRPLEISLCRRRRSSPPRAVVAVPGVLLRQLRSGVDPEADPVWLDVSSSTQSVPAQPVRRRLPPAPPDRRPLSPAPTRIGGLTRLLHHRPQLSVVKVNAG